MHQQSEEPRRRTDFLRGFAQSLSRLAEYGHWGQRHGLLAGDVAAEFGPQRSVEIGPVRRQLHGGLVAAADVSQRSPRCHRRQRSQRLHCQRAGPARSNGESVVADLGLCFRGGRHLEHPLVGRKHQLASHQCRRGRRDGKGPQLVRYRRPDRSDLRLPHHLFGLDQFCRALWKPVQLLQQQHHDLEYEFEPQRGSGSGLLRRTRHLPARRRGGDAGHRQRFDHGLPNRGDSRWQLVGRRARGRRETSGMPAVDLLGLSARFVVRPSRLRERLCARGQPGRPHHNRPRTLRRAPFSFPGSVPRGRRTGPPCWRWASG